MSSTSGHLFIYKTHNGELIKSQAGIDLKRHLGCVSAVVIGRRRILLMSKETFTSKTP